MNWRESGGSGKRREERRPRDPASTPAAGDRRTGWRSKKSAAGAGESGKRGKTWATREVDPNEIRRTAFRIRLFGVLGLVALLIAVFIVALLWVPKQTQFVVVAPRDTSRGTWRATKDLNEATRQGFRSVAGDNKNLIVIDEGTEAFLNPDSPWDDSIRTLGLQLLGPNKRLLVYFLSAPTAVRDEGGEVTPYFLPHSDHPLEDFEHWISVERVLASIAQSAPTSARAEKLVLIDAQRVEPIAAPGLLYDRFPDAVAAAFRRLSAAGVGNLHVIVSHSNGERNWRLPEVGGTAFSYVLQRALRGEADGLVDANGKVCLLELARFLQQGLPGYVKDRRQAMQTPTILSPALQARDATWEWSAPNREFGVVFVDGASFRRWRDRQAAAARESPPLPADMAARGQQLDAQWQRFETLRDRNVLERFPVLAAEATALLVRMEQLQLEANTNELSELQNQLRKRLDAIDPPAISRTDTSLAIARLRNSTNLPNGEELERHLQMWRDRIRLREGLAVADEAARAKAVDDLKLFDAGPVTTLTPWQLLNLVWTGFSRQGDTAEQSDAPWGRFTRDDLEFWAQRLASNPITPLAPVESHFLELMRRQVDWEQAHVAAAPSFYLAIQTHDLAERIVYATRQQPEILPWIQPDLLAAEQHRRSGEDLLMANQFPEAHARLGTARTQLAAVELKLQQVQQAMITRNQACYESPHLLMWMLRQDSTQRARRAALGGAAADGEESNPDRDRQRWVELVNDLSELDRVLNTAANGATALAWGETEQRRATRVKDRLTELTNEFRTFARNLESRGNDTTTLVDIENALLNPLLNTQVRVELRRRYGEILQAYADRPIPDFASFAATAIVSGETATQFQERLQQLALAAVKDLNDPIVQPLLESSFAGTWNGLVVPAQHEPLQQRLNNPSESASLAADCERLQPVDSALRRAAHCLAELPNTAGPAWQAQARAVSVDLFQQQSALQTCFEASRSVEDCWGNNESIAVGTTPTSDPYFVAATRQQLGRLEKSAAKGTREVQQVREQLERYLTAVTNISVSANKLVFQPEVSDTPQTIGVQLPEQLPAGFAAAAIRHMGEQPVTVEVKLENSATARKFAVPTAAGAPGQGPDSSLECFVPVQTYLSGRSRGDFEALVAFRGHVRTQNFRAERARSNVIAAPEEVLIALEPQPLGLPNIEVRKEGKNITDVIVVVDCSASMNDKLQIQGEIGGIEENRLDHLKAAIEEVFATMAESGSFRVALVAFGHRAKHAKVPEDAPRFSVVFRDPEKGKAEWKDILPHTDAQILFNALGQSGPTSAAGYEQMTDRLRQLQPYGQTPLYYSIQFAAEQFPKSNQAGIPRQIIVLTDGLNDTYHFDNQGLLRPRSIEGGRDSDFAYYNELVRNDSPTELLRGIQVQIVAVDVVNTDPKAEALFAKKKLQLEKIAQATGGKTLYPRSIDELKQHLDRIVNDEVWTVRAESGRLDSGELRMGTSWTPPDRSVFDPGYFTIALARAGDSKRVFLEGGEVIVLEFAQDRRLQFRRDENLNLLRSQSRVLGGGETGGKYLVGLLYPNTHREENELGFSFQNEDARQFSQRPKRVCLEVLPVDGSPKHTYFLQDYNVEIKRQSPVVRFPKIALSPGQNALRLWVLPFSEKPLTFERTVEVGENRQTTAKWDEIDVVITREDGGLEVKLSGGDPVTRRTMLVDLLIGTGNEWRRSEGQRVVRRFLVDGSANLHEFELPSESGEPKLAIGLSRLENVFTADQAISFDDVTLTPK